MKENRMKQSPSFKGRAAYSTVAAGVNCMPGGGIAPERDPVGPVPDFCRKWDEPYIRATGMSGRFYRTASIKEM